MYNCRFNVYIFSLHSFVLLWEEDHVQEQHILFVSRFGNIEDGNGLHWWNKAWHSDIISMKFTLRSQNLPPRKQNKILEALCMYVCMYVYVCVCVCVCVPTHPPTYLLIYLLAQSSLLLAKFMEIIFRFYYTNKIYPQYVICVFTNQTWNR
jgi:hypothetical protein